MSPISPYNKSIFLILSNPDDMAEGPGVQYWDKVGAVAGGSLGFVGSGGSGGCGGCGDSCPP